MSGRGVWTQLEPIVIWLKKNGQQIEEWNRVFTGLEDRKIWKPVPAGV